jgi:hypothetical protein
MRFRVPSTSLTIVRYLHRPFRLSRRTGIATPSRYDAFPQAPACHAGDLAARLNHAASRRASLFAGRGDRSHASIAARENTSLRPTRRCGISPRPAPSWTVFRLSPRNRPTSLALMMSLFRTAHSSTQPPSYGGNVSSLSNGNEWPFSAADGSKVAQ